MSMNFFMTTQNSILYVHGSFIFKSRNFGTLGRNKQVVVPTGINDYWLDFFPLSLSLHSSLCMRAGGLLISLAYRPNTSGCDVLAMQGRRKQLEIAATSRML